MALNKNKKEANFNQEKITNKKEEFIRKYLPDYIRPADKPSLIYNLVKMVKSRLVEHVYGQENLPVGEKLFISRHNEGDDIWRLMVALDEKVHLVASETIHWQDQLLFGVKKNLMKELEMLPLRAKFPELSLEEKKEILKRAPFWEKRNQEKILRYSAVDLLKNKKYLKQIVAVLLAGQNIQLFVDGLWTRLKNDPRHPFPGYGLIAKLYQKINEQALPIIPVAFKKKDVYLGKPFYVDKQSNREELSEIARFQLERVISKNKTT